MKELIKKIGRLGGAAIVLHLFLLLGTKFTAWPEMLAWPHFVLNGWFPYKDIAIAHTPLLLVKLSIFDWIFGVGIPQLKVFTWLLILLLDIFVFWIADRLWGKKVAIFTLLFYIPLQIFYEGNGLWFDLYMTFSVLALFYFTKTKRFMLAGVYWALAILSKQTAIWFAVPLGLSMIQKSKVEIGKAKKFIKGFTIVALFALLIFLSFDILDDFWKWAIDFGVFILPRASGQSHFPSFRQLVSSLLPFTILVPLFLKNKKERVIILWALAGAAGVYPRFEFFHFQPALPFVAMSAGIVFSSKKDKILKAFLAFYIALTLTLFGKVVQRDWGAETRFYEAEVQEVVQEVKESNASTVYVLNYWDNIYALTNTLPVTRPWIPYLPWYLDLEGVREGILNDLKLNMPEVMVVGVKPDYNWEEMALFIERFYSCNVVSEKVEICFKNGQ